MSAEFDALMASTQLEREKADGIRSLVASVKATTKAQDERDAALALVERIKALCDDAEDRRDWVRCADLRAMLGTS
jgi:hypothetical protein